MGRAAGPLTVLRSICSAPPTIPRRYRSASRPRRSRNRVSLSGAPAGRHLRLRGLAGRRRRRPAGIPTVSDRASRGLAAAARPRRRRPARRGRAPPRSEASSASHGSGGRVPSGISSGRVGFFSMRLDLGGRGGVDDLLVRAACWRRPPPRRSRGWHVPAAASGVGGAGRAARRRRCRSPSARSSSGTARAARTAPAVRPRRRARPSSRTGGPAPWR